jgi:quinoprotein glucose dehydrogenase
MRKETRVSVLLLGAVLSTTLLDARSLRWQQGNQAVERGARNAWVGVYSKAQAERGRETFRRACGYCHRDNLLGDYGPPLVGVDFTYPWDGRTLAELYETVVSTMPPASAVDVARVSRQDYVDIISFVLSSNGFPPGASELPMDIGTLRKIVFTRQPPRQ